MNQANYSDAIVWLPTYNEEMNILRMIRDIQDLGFRVNVTDGGSTDRTVALALQSGVEVLRRPGKHKGYGIRHAIEESDRLGYKKFIYIDCDQTYPVTRLPEMYDLSDSYDIVVAARDFSKIVFMNRMANYLFTGLINLLFRSRLRDTQSGMRVIHIDKFIGKIHSDAFDLETELTCIALKNELKMKELEVDYYPRVGKSKATLLQAILIFRRILVCRLTGK